MAYKGRVGEEGGNTTIPEGWGTRMPPYSRVQRRRACRPTDTQAYCQHLLRTAARKGRPGMLTPSTRIWSFRLLCLSLHQEKEEGPHVGPSSFFRVPDAAVPKPETGFSKPATGTSEPATVQPACLATGFTCPTEDISPRVFRRCTRTFCA